MNNFLASKWNMSAKMFKDSWENYQELEKNMIKFWTAWITWECHLQQHWAVGVGHLPGPETRIWSTTPFCYEWENATNSLWEESCTRSAVGWERPSDLPGPVCPPSPPCMSTNYNRLAKIDKIWFNLRQELVLQSSPSHCKVDEGRLSLQVQGIRSLFHLSADKVSWWSYEIHSTDENTIITD